MQHLSQLYQALPRSSLFFTTKKLMYKIMIIPLLLLISTSRLTGFHQLYNPLSKGRKNTQLLTPFSSLQSNQTPEAKLVGKLLLLIISYIKKRTRKSCFQEQWYLFWVFQKEKATLGICISAMVYQQPYCEMVLKCILCKYTNGDKRVA